jgi:hypothetical protein
MTDQRANGLDEDFFDDHLTYGSLAFMPFFRRVAPP